MVMTMARMMDGRSMAKAAGAASAAAPYIRRMMSDEELRQSVRDLANSASHLVRELQSEDRLHKLVDDKRVRKDVDEMLDAMQHAGRRIVKPRRNWAMTFLWIGVAGGVVALLVWPRSRRQVTKVASEGVSKVRQRGDNVVPMDQAA
jgi:hypothetical protein